MYYIVTGASRVLIPAWEFPPVVSERLGKLSRKSKGLAMIAGGTV